MLFFNDNDEYNSEEDTTRGDDDSFLYLTVALFVMVFGIILAFTV